jgi:HAD superfamily hydrolase (TIGR01484 family)
MEPYTIIVFDLDGTLSESKIAVDPEMADLLCKLLKKKTVAVISGASFEQFEKQFLSNLSCPPVNLSVLPANGSAFLEYKAVKGSEKGDEKEAGTWQTVYEKKLSDIQKVLIRTAMDSVLKKYAELIPQKTYGERLADIGLGMTFSALGQDAPLDEKQKWDPDHSKRSKIVADLQPLLPDIEMTIGGTTSINITVKGADKKNAILALAKHFGVSKDCLSSDILYIGDSLFVGGNDYGAIASGVATQKVSGPADTKKIIRDILKA